MACDEVSTEKVDALLPSNSPKKQEMFGFTENDSTDIRPATETEIMVPSLNVLPMGIIEDDAIGLRIGFNQLIWDTKGILFENQYLQVRLLF